MLLPTEVKPMTDEGFICDICETAFQNERDLATHDCEAYADTPAGWVVQEGLGDADAQGQTTLDGGIKPEGGGRDA